MPIDPVTAIGTGLAVGKEVVGIFGRRKQREWNEEQARIQRQWNLDQWHRENKYNSPEAQLQRLRDAGLNPHLLYGQGVAGATGQAGSVQGYAQPDSVNLAEGFDPLSPFLNIRDNIATNEVKAAQIHNIEAQTLSTLTRSQLDALELEIQEGTKDARINGIYERMEQEKQKTIQTSKKTDWMLADRETKKQILNQELANLKAAKDQTEAGTRLRTMEAEYGRKQVVEMLEDIMKGESEGLQKFIKMAIILYLNK